MDIESLTDEMSAVDRVSLIKEPDHRWYVVHWRISNGYTGQGSKITLELIRAFFNNNSLRPGSYWIDAKGVTYWIQYSPEIANSRAVTNWEFDLTNPSTYRLVKVVVDTWTCSNLGADFFQNAIAQRWCPSPIRHEEYQGQKRALMQKAMNMCEKGGYACLTCFDCREILLMNRSCCGNSVCTDLSHTNIMSCPDCVKVVPIKASDADLVKDF